jgi:hypothetical protein
LNAIHSKKRFHETAQITHFRERKITEEIYNLNNSCSSEMFGDIKSSRIKTFTE